MTVLKSPIVSPQSNLTRCADNGSNSNITVSTSEGYRENDNQDVVVLKSAQSNLTLCPDTGSNSNVTSTLDGYRDNDNQSDSFEESSYESSEDTEVVSHTLICIIYS